MATIAARERRREPEQNAMDRVGLVEHTRFLSSIKGSSIIFSACPALLAELDFHLHVGAGQLPPRRGRNVRTSP